jgi:hypothetical protein
MDSGLLASLGPGMTRGLANAAPPGCLTSARAPPVPFFLLPQRGMERRETPEGLRDPRGAILGVRVPPLAVACAKKGRDCEFRPEAPSWVPSGCEPKGYLRRRLPALHRRFRIAPTSAGTSAAPVSRRPPRRQRPVLRPCPRPSRPPRRVMTAPGLRKEGMECSLYVLRGIESSATGGIRAGQSKRSLWKASGLPSIQRCATA